MSGRYPSDEELAAIREWDVLVPGGSKALLEYARSIWNWPEYAWVEGGMYHFATGGWSGNEDIEQAMQENQMLSLLCWQSSHRGGLTRWKPCEPKASS